MSLEAWTTIAAVGTFVVITITAVAAFEERLVDRTVHPERHVIAWFEHIGAWMKNGLIDEQTYLEYPHRDLNIDVHHVVERR